MFRAFILFLLTLVVLIFVTAFPAAAQVEQVCYMSGLDNVPPGWTMYSIVYDPTSGAVYFERTVTGGGTDLYQAITPILVPITAQEDIYVDGFGPMTFYAADPIWHMPFSDCVGGRIGDGRVNDGADQLGAPLAAYCKSGSLEVWDIGTDARGTLGFTASADEIDAGLADAAASGLPTLISSGLGNSLYATPHGNLALLGPDLRDPGKEYKFEFSGSRCG
jgi:hypothetical protein